MLPADEEFLVWREVKRHVYDLLCEVYEERDSTKSTPWEDTPEFDELERLISKVSDFVEGRMQELDAEYSERTEPGQYGKQAKLAREYGINYIPFKGMWPKDMPAAFEWIKSEGLASMNYEKTCKARDKYSQHLWDTRRIVQC